MVYMFIECLYCRTIISRSLCIVLHMNKTCVFIHAYLCMHVLQRQIQNDDCDKVELSTIYHFWCLTVIDFGCLFISDAMKSRHRQEDNFVLPCPGDMNESVV
ncbi:hypothetical protein DFJ58DRAFT_765150 [Suillus subalutaceus]|uniref:uncharacterized protein n=1 Tax=Suillus subalutaceus TaxID=48586 RepID=UPI001B864827|nr:uncharacterized protein DFJ58DRAFT_765150 [Suillus subalutaceus]KAG1870203.1 hypothetical protein DFJ58DRAFT_765150 [Suillus subalutaceus]